MKNILFIIFFSSLLACSATLNRNKKENDYKIIDIDSINNYYLVYAKKEDSLFKIVSKKEEVKNAKKIELNKNYTLDLYSRKSEAPTINGVKIAPINIIDIMCYNYENNTQICTDRKKGIYDLYSTKNLKGIYYIK